MELRPDASHKENVPPRPATPLRPEPRRLLVTQSLDVVLGPWGPRGQAERGGPATTPSPGAMLRQESCRVQTNLASPSPCLGLALNATTGPNRLINSSFQQQSNLQPLHNLPQGGTRALAVQQRNLGTGEASLATCGSRSSPHLWLKPPESSWPHVMPLGSPLPRGPQARPSSTLKQSQLFPTDTPRPDFRPTACYALVNGRTWPGPSSWGGLGNWATGLMGEPLTLEDLAVPAKSQGQAPSQAAMSQLLVSVQCLEHEVARLRSRGTQEPPVPSQQEPWTSDGQGLPACPQPSQPVLASWDKRKKHPEGLKGAVNFPGTPGTQLGPSDSQAGSKPKSLPPETTSEVLTQDFLNSKQGILPTYALRQGERPAYSRGQRGPPLPQGVGSREARLCSSTFSRAARGVLPGQDGGAEAPQGAGQQGDFLSASHGPSRKCPAEQSPKHHKPGAGDCLPAAAVQMFQSLAAPGAEAMGYGGRGGTGPTTAVAQGPAGTALATVAPGGPARGGMQPTHKGPAGLELPEVEKPDSAAETRAVLHPAWARTPTLWGRPLRKEASSGSCPEKQSRESEGGGGSPAGPIPLLGPDRMEETGELRSCRPCSNWLVRAFLLWCRRKEWARQEQTGVQRETSGAIPSTRSMGRAPQAWSSPAADAAWVAPLDPQHQRAWLRRCFGAWRWVVKRGTQYPGHLTDHPMGALRMCLKQWMKVKRLRALEDRALCSSTPGGATSHGLEMVTPAQGLPQEQNRGSLQEARPRLTLHQALLLWRVRLSQCQRADSFFQGTQRQMLKHILRVWRLTVCGPGTPSDSARTTWAPEPLGGVPGGEASLGCSPLEKDFSAPALLENLRLSFLWATGWRQQGRCLLLWQAQAQQSRGAMKWHQRMLQRRVLLGWRHWATAQGARRELAARWAWDRSCRAALGLWRRRLEQWREAEQRTQERGRRRARDALRHWRACWQRQQFLEEQYRRWVQVRIQGSRRAVFQSWQRAAAQRRHGAAQPEQLLLQSHFQAWCGSARKAGMLRAQCQAFQDGLRRRALGAAFTTWWEARVAAAWTREHRAPWASIAHWRSRVLSGRAGRQLRRARAQQAWVAWRAALGQCCEAHQQAEERARAWARGAPCWTLRVPESHLLQLSQAHPAQKLNARVPEAWAQSASQGRVQWVAITQSQQVGRRHLLWTHWAQWRTALLRVWLEPQMEAQETSTAHPRPRAELRHWPRLAGRGCFQVPMDTAAPGKQTGSRRPQGREPRLGGPAGPTQHHCLGGQRESRETPWAQTDDAVQLWTPWPGLTHYAQDQPPAGPGRDYSSEASTLTGKGQRDKTWLGRRCLRGWHREALLRRLQGSQQARRLAATWQRWVDAQGAEELSRSLLRQWHLRGAWRMWRRRVVQLQVAQRVQQQDNGWVLSQAFEKWHQNLAARALQRGATSKQPETPK